MRQEVASAQYMKALHDDHDSEGLDLSAVSSAIFSAVSERYIILYTPSKIVYLPLSYSRNPGVNGGSYRGVNGNRLGRGKHRRLHMAFRRA